MALPADHAWCAKSSIDAAELIQENLLLLGSGHCFRDQVLKVCPALNRTASSPGSMQKTLESSSLETIRHMVASGAGDDRDAVHGGADRGGGAGLLVFRPFSDTGAGSTGRTGVAQEFHASGGHRRGATSGAAKRYALR